MANTGAKPIFVASAGGIFLYSGFKGLKLSTTIRDLLTGRNPAKESPDPTLAAYNDPFYSNADGSPTSNIYHGGSANDPNKQGPAGEHLTAKQIYALARQAGFTRTGAIYMTAITLAESGGRPNARCHNCVAGVTEDSRGLAQVNVDAHPWALQGNLYDPLTNLKAAYAISSQGRNFSPWSTFLHGTYQTFMPEALRAAGG